MTLNIDFSQNNNINNMEIITLYVKQVFTNKTNNYYVDVNSPLKIIMSEILRDAHSTFTFDEGTQLELVEAGQFIPGIQSEHAPAIELDSQEETFKEHFGNNYKHIAFYIRKA
jgi:hypothetical protein